MKTTSSREGRRQPSRANISKPDHVRVLSPLRMTELSSSICCQGAVCRFSMSYLQCTVYSLDSSCLPRSVFILPTLPCWPASLVTCACRLVLASCVNPRLHARPGPALGPLTCQSAPLRGPAPCAQRNPLADRLMGWRWREKIHIDIQISWIRLHDTPNGLVPPRIHIIRFLGMTPPGRLTRTIESNTIDHQ